MAGLDCSHDAGTSVGFVDVSLSGAAACRGAGNIRSSRPPFCQVAGSFLPVWLVRYGAAAIWLVAIFRVYPLIFRRTGQYQRPLVLGALFNYV